MILYKLFSNISLNYLLYTLDSWPHKNIILFLISQYTWHSIKITLQIIYIFIIKFLYILIIFPFYSHTKFKILFSILVSTKHQSIFWKAEHDVHSFYHLIWWSFKKSPTSSYENSISCENTPIDIFYKFIFSLNNFRGMILILIPSIWLKIK
jgi:hypothetical protein